MLELLVLEGCVIAVVILMIILYNVSQIYHQGDITEMGLKWLIVLFILASILIAVRVIP